MPSFWKVDTTFAGILTNTRNVLNAFVLEGRHNITRKECLWLPVVNAFVLEGRHNSNHNSTKFSTL